MQMLRSEQLSTAERLLLTDSLDWLEEVDRGDLGFIEV